MHIYICITWPRCVNLAIFFKKLKHEYKFALSLICQWLNGAGRRNPAVWKTNSHISFIVNTVVADDLVMQGARPWGEGVLWKFFDRSVRLRFIYRIPSAKEILVKNIPLAKENFLIMSPFLHDFKEFQPKYTLFKRNFLKTDANLAQKCQF